MEPVFESVAKYGPEEFAAWVRGRESSGDAHRYELLRGRIVMTPPAAYPHGAIETRISAPMSVFVRASGLGEVFGSSQGFRLPTDDIVEPDVAFVARARLEAAAPVVGEFLRVVPDVVVEILSPSTRDYDVNEKRGIYERAGVREYWLVDPDARRVTILSLDDRGAFRDRSDLVRGGFASSGVLEGFRLELRDVFP